MTDGGVARQRYERRAYAQKVTHVLQACARVEAGESLAEVCRDPTMPQRSTLNSWLLVHPELNALMQAAKARAAETHPPRRECHRWNPALADEVLARVAAGRGVYEVCAEPDMPAASTVMRWVKERPDYAQAYVLAREAQAERLFDLAWRIACEATEDSVGTSRLKIQTLKWRLARLFPLKYGTRALGVEAELPEAEPTPAPAQTPVWEIRQFAVTPEREVVEVTGAVRGLPRAEVEALKADVRAGRLTEADVAALNAQANAALRATLRLSEPGGPR